MKAPAGGEQGRLFAYGTLIIPRVMRAVTGRTFDSEPAGLEGYARFGLKGRTYPGLVASPGSSTAGVLYHGLDRMTLRILDRFEDEFYERRVVSVRAGGRTLPAMTYVIPERHRKLLEATDWDAAAFEQEHMTAFLDSLGTRLGEERSE